MSNDISSVYVVTSQYASHRVDAVFSDIETALAYSAKKKAAISGWDGQVERHDLDLPPDKWGGIHVSMSKDGKVIRTSESWVEPFDSYISRSNSLEVLVRTQDVDHAIKEANRIRNLWLANNLPWKCKYKNAMWVTWDLDDD